MKRIILMIALSLTVSNSFAYAATLLTKEEKKYIEAIIDQDKHQELDQILQKRPDLVNSFLRPSPQKSSLECPKTTLVEIAAYHHSINCLRVLIARGANLRPSNSLLLSPFHTAELNEVSSARYNIFCLELLLITARQKNIDLAELQSVEEGTVLHQAILNEHFTNIKLILKYFPELKSVPNEDGQTPKQVAIGTYTLDGKIDDDKDPIKVQEIIALLS